MAGLLDNKSRMIDTVVTQEGRRQISSGELRIVFASFTDGAAFYEADAVSGSTDAGQRAYFEANSLLQDAIAFEADDSGVLIGKAGLFREKTGLQGSKIVAAESGSFLKFVTGSAFASSGSKLLKASLDNFRKLRVLGSRGPFDEGRDFILNQNSASFILTNESPIPMDTGLTSVAVDNAGEIFSDPKLSHLPNFRFLPPVNAPTSPAETPRSLGAFQPLGPRFELSPTEVMNQMVDAESRGTSYEIEFVSTSPSNNVFAQFFEIGNTDLTKLDVIDYGSFITPDSPTSKHVFFVGKVFTNGFGVHTFVNMFTLMFFDKNIVPNVL